MRTFYKFLMITILSGLTFGVANCQTTVHYSYDNAGNRITRTITVSQSMTSQSTLKSGIVDSTMYSEDSQEDLLNEQKDQKITIYPNPTKGELKVEVTNFDPLLKSDAAIYTQTGKLVLKKSPITGSDIIDIAEQPNGLYILRITIGKNIQEWKIIKE